MAMAAKQFEERGKRRKDWLEFDRADRIGLRVLLWLTIAAFLAVEVLGPIIDWVRGRSLQVPFASDIVVPELDRVGTGYAAGEYSVVVSDPSTVGRVLSLLPGLVAVGLLVAGALILQRLMRDIATGDPFAAAQVGRLRWLAGLLVLGVPLHGFAGLIARTAILSGQDLGGLSRAISAPLPIPAMLVGMLLALLAEAFRAGRRLREDVEGLV